MWVGMQSSMRYVVLMDSHLLDHAHSTNCRVKVFYRT